MKRFLIILISIFIFIGFIFPDNNDNAGDSKIKIKPYLIIEQKSDIITGVDNSSDTIKFDSFSNELSLNAGFTIPLHKRFILKPFVKNLTLWRIDSLGIPEFTLNELSLAIAGIIPVTKELKFGIVLASAEVFMPNQVLWSGFKVNLGLNYTAEKFIYFNITNTTKPLFRLDTDNKFKTFLTNQLETEFSITVFKKINSGLFLYDNFIYSSIFMGKMIPKLNFTNELEAGFQFMPIDLLSIYTLGSFDFLYQKDNLLKTTNINYEVGIDLKLKFNYKYLTLVVGYNPKFYRNINGANTIPTHNFELNVFVNI